MTDPQFFQFNLISVSIEVDPKQRNRKKSFFCSDSRSPIPDPSSTKRFRNEFGMTHGVEETSGFRCRSIRFLIRLESPRGLISKNNKTRSPIPDPRSLLYKEIPKQVRNDARKNNKARLPVPDPRSLRYKEMPKQVRNDARKNSKARLPIPDPLSPMSGFRRLDSKSDLTRPDATYTKTLHLLYSALRYDQ